MYCTQCGRKLDEDERFCSYCGKKAVHFYTSAPDLTSEQGTYVAHLSSKQTATLGSTTAPRTTYTKTSGKTGLYAGIAGAVVIAAVILSITVGNADSSDNLGNSYSMPQYNAPYTVPYDDNIILPPVDYDFSGDDYGSYNDSDTVQICPSCHSSGYCPICNGTGQYSMYGTELSTCSACGGSGTCSICDGDGYE